MASGESQQPPRKKSRTDAAADRSKKSSSTFDDNCLYPSVQTAQSSAEIVFRRRSSLFRGTSDDVSVGEGKARGQSYCSFIVGIATLNRDDFVPQRVERSSDTTDEQLVEQKTEWELFNEITDAWTLGVRSSSTTESVLSADTLNSPQFKFVDRVRALLNDDAGGSVRALWMNLDPSYRTPQVRILLRPHRDMKYFVGLKEHVDALANYRGECPVESRAYVRCTDVYNVNAFVRQLCSGVERQFLGCNDERLLEVIRNETTWISASTRTVDAHQRHRKLEKIAHTLKRMKREDERCDGVATDDVVLDVEKKGADTSLSPSSSWW